MLVYFLKDRAVPSQQVLSQKLLSIAVFRDCIEVGIYWHFIMMRLFQTQVSISQLPVHATQLVASEIAASFACATLPVLEELREDVRESDTHLRRPPRAVTCKTRHDVTVTVLALGQDGPALPSASCEALSTLSALSLRCGFASCKMGITVAVTKDAWAAWNRMHKALRALAYRQCSVNAGYSPFGGI